MEPAFLSAALLAAAGAGFDLSGLALRTRHDPAQVVWHRRAFAHEDKAPAEIDAEAVRQAMHLALQERSEPAPYLYLHAAGLVAMAADHSLRWRPEALAQIHAPIQAALAEPEFVHHAESPNPEIGLWGLAEWDAEAEPLPDRVEVAAVHFLQKNPGCTLRDLETALNAEFSGLLTPSLGILRAVLASYAVETDGTLEPAPGRFPIGPPRTWKLPRSPWPLWAHAWGTPCNARKAHSGLSVAGGLDKRSTLSIFLPPRWWGVSCARIVSTP